MAWDGARVIIAAIDCGYQGWLAYVLGERIDAEYYGFVLTRGRACTPGQRR